ncbi:MAG: type II toxin-antitoxin system VapC family toxin [Acidobacteriota bacterium]|nr:type II toxin-antitoxin system VapC family toxin [Acidobacteriota bacterium]
MRLLLDTHAAIWLVNDDKRLGDRARDATTDRANTVLLSAALVWEIAIKRALRKLEVPDGYVTSLLEYAFVPLEITLEHAAAVEHLPHHHGDPFDRMLVAQALVEGITLLTADPVVARYPGPIRCV